MKKSTLLLIAALVPFFAFAQQKPQYSQYVINNFLLNPAISGIEDYTDIKLGARNQWQGVEGAPTTVYLSVHSRLLNGQAGASLESRNRQPQSFAKYREARSIYRKVTYKPWHGIGALVLHDKIGPFSRTEANMTYAYHLPLNENIRLSGGASVGVTQARVAAGSLNFANPDAAAGNNRSSFGANLSTGLWLYSSDFYVGISAAEMLGNTISMDSYGGRAGESRNHYFATGAYKIGVNQRLALVPSVMVKWLQPVPVSIDYNLRLLYHDKIWVGGSYRQHDSFAAMGGFTINKTFDLSYSYDSGLSTLKGMSHEVILGVRLYKSHLPANTITNSDGMW